MTEKKTRAAWIERYCRVPEGRQVGKPVKLLPWQKEDIRRIYDNPAGTRRAILSFGRKNGKTALAALLLLLHLCGPEARVIPNSVLLPLLAAILLLSAVKVWRHS